MKTITRTIRLTKVTCIVYNTESKQNETMELIVERAKNTERRISNIIKHRHPHLRLVMIEAQEDFTKTLTVSLEDFIEFATTHPFEPDHEIEDVD